VLPEQNLDNLKQEIRNTVQPVFDQVLSLNMWAKIWADEEYDLDLGVDEELRDALRAVAITYDDVALDATDDWTAKMKIFCSVELQGETLSVEIAVQNGFIEKVDVRTKTLNPTLSEIDLAATYAKKVTWAALQ